MARPVTRSKLARLAGVSPAAITKACKNSLKAATLGKRVDLDHPATVAYLASKGVGPTSGPETAAAPSVAPTQDRPSETAEAPPREPEPDPLAEQLAKYGGLTLNEIVRRHGTVQGFKDWLDATKKIADTREKVLRNDETQGRLIGREYVRTHVFGAIESGNRRLLSDSPKTIARRLYSLARSGASLEEAETVVRDLISAQLRLVSVSASRALKE